MAVKSILEISVEDAAFTKYKALFDKYQAELKKHPEIWKQLGKQQRELASQWTNVANTFAKHLNQLEEAKNKLEDQEKHVSLAERLWAGMEKSSKGVSSHIANATTSLLKWSGLLSGITGLLGYFSFEGLMHLGSNVSGFRQSSMGLGVGIGQQRAFNIAFDRLLPGHTESFLSGINAMVSNLGAQGPLYALGVNPNAPTADVAVNTLKRLRQIATGTPTNQLGIVEQMYQLQSMGVSVEDLRRLQSMSGGEFGQLLGTYGQQTKILALNEKTAKAWQDFVTSIDLAKGRIENVFVKGLVPLTAPLEHLAGGFSHLLEVLMGKHGTLSDGIDKTAKWMEQFSGQIAKPEFLTKMERFMSDLGQIADLIHAIVVSPVFKGWADIGNLWTGGNGKGVMDSWSNLWHGITSPIRSLVGGNQNERIKYMQQAAGMDARLFGGLPLLQTVGMLESGMNPDIRNSAAGAVGMMQIMPSVASSLGINPRIPSDALWGASTLLQRYLDEYHGDVAKALAAYNWGEGNLNRDIASHGARWQSFLPPETLNYLVNAFKAFMASGFNSGFNVTVTNKTGANVNASVAAQGGIP